MSDKNSGLEPSNNLNSRVRSVQMAIDKPIVRWAVIAIVLLLLVPLVFLLGMMSMGAVFGGGMMSHMGGMMGMEGMMGGGPGAGMMSHGVMALCTVWLTLVVAALIFLIVLLAR